MVYNIDDETITQIFNVQNRSSKYQVNSKCYYHLQNCDKIGVRYQKYKLVWGISTMLHRTYRQKDVRRSTILELYDLEKDPRESVNIAARNL